MISKQFVIIFMIRTTFQDVDDACHWKSVGQKVRKRLPNIDPNFTLEGWLEPLNLGSSRVRFGTCWLKDDDDTPAHTRAIQSHRSRAIVKLEFFKNVIEVPHGWTNVLYHSSPNSTSTCLIAGRIGRKEGRQACCSSAADIRNNADRSEKLEATDRSLSSSKDTVSGSDLVKAQDMGPTFCRTSSYAVVDFGDIPAECIAKFVGNYQTILYEKTIRSRTARTGSPSRFPRIG